MRVVLILMDAFRHDYLNENVTPFLSRMASEGIFYKKVVPGPGFCERSEVFTGLSPSLSNNLLAIGWGRPKINIVNRAIIGVLSLVERLILLDRLENRGGVWRKFRYLIYLLNERINFLPDYGSFLIPLRQLNKFCLTEDCKFNGLGFRKESLFQILPSRNHEVILDCFTALGVRDRYLSDNMRLTAAQAQLLQMKSGLLPIYISLADAQGHKYGPYPESFQKELNLLDTYLEQFYNRVRKQERLTKFMFLGDHGMAEIKHQVDARKLFLEIVDEFGLKEWRDFEVFLDSTVLRVWLNSPEALRWREQYDFSSCVKMPHGRWILQEEYATYDLPSFDRRYGDMLWWANTGVLVFPNYFNSSPPLGMHGYLEKTDENSGVLIVRGTDTENQVEDKIKLTEIYELIKNEFSEK